MDVVSDLVTRLAEAEARYVAENPESRRLHEERTRFMPAGTRERRFTSHRFR
jgi:hypothetical protein